MTVNLPANLDMDDFPLMIKAKMNPEGLRTEIEASYKELRSRTNAFAHKLAVKVRGREYADEARDDPAKRYTICFEDPSSFPESPVSDSLTSLLEAADTSTPDTESREKDVIQDTAKAKARAKARALAELKLEEMEARELQVQMKIKRIEAKRELLELDEDDD